MGMKPPAPPPAPEAPEPLPTEVDMNIIKARQFARRHAATRRGRSATVLTRPTGLSSMINM